MKLWQANSTRITSSNMQRFQELVFHKFPQNFEIKNNTRFKTQAQVYQELWLWSVQHKTKFWKEVLKFTNLQVVAPSTTQEHKVFQSAESFTKSTFFDNYLINYSQNLLKNPQNNQPALIFWNENGKQNQWSYQELKQKTIALASYFQEIGLQKGDRIVAYMPNIPETVCVFLATAAIGCVFASCSSDFGVEGVLDRFSQIRPKALLVCPEYFYAGKKIDIRLKIQEITKKLPSLQHKISFDYPLQKTLFIEDFTQAASIFQKPIKPSFSFTSFPFNHPLYILFSSGTTGYPKCIVHSSGGALLQQVKELQLHCDLKTGEKIFFYTTCGWMMWNWVVAALACNASVGLYDGSPTFPPKVLWNYVAKEHINIFGLGAKVVDFYRNQNFSIQKEYSLINLKTILTTGSVLSHECFDYIYQQVKKDIHLASISGGTDIVSCFMLGSPTLAVHRGQLQCAGLGMDIDVFCVSGKPTLEKGELVCKSPFPSKPLYFWGDVDSKKIHKAYFSKFAGVWTHGDYVQKNKEGCFVIYGRSDTTLNPGGVRIGTAEIYRIVEKLPEVEESIVIGQDWKKDIRIILFVKLAAEYQLDNKLIQKIKTQLKEKASFKHVPQKILTTLEIPRTRSGKIVELAVKNVVEGKKVDNVEALANPESLYYYLNRKELVEK